LIGQMLQQREQWGELVPLGAVLDDALLDNEVRPRLERALEAIVAHGLQRAIDLLPAGALEFLTKFAQRMASEPGYNGEPSPLTICLDKHEPPQAVASCLDHWAALLKLVLTSSGDWRRGFNTNHILFEMPKPDRAELKQFVQEIESDRLLVALNAVLVLPPARYPEDQWRVAKALFRVLSHALAQLKVLFFERGECDFAELALSAREVLRSEATTPELALAAGGHLRHMLIDEMQDTSAGQYELVNLLTHSWDGQSQTLFLVGDPKQSIYLFRAARVERFLRTMQEAQLGEIPLNPLRLTANFRSQAGLVEGPLSFNEAFSKLFGPLETVRAPDPFEAVDVPFVAATAQRSRTQDEGMVWHTAILGEEELEEGLDHRQQEAREIRRIIEQRLALRLPAARTKPWRIAVLGHGRRHLEAIVEEFKTPRTPEGTNIPAKPLAFKAIDLDSLETRPEVLDALALTRALLHPADRTAWLAVLRAPWCGLGRADLLALTGDGAGSSATIAGLVAEHRDRLSPEGQALLARAWPILETAVATLGRSSMATHVVRTWRSLGGDATLTTEQRENVLRMLTVLSDVEGDGGRIDLEVLTAQLRSLYAESAATADVELLTIHKAKGLEWDLVLVPGLERRTGQSRHLLLNWLEFDPESRAEEAAVILAPISGKGTPAGRLSDWLGDLRRRRGEAEHKRLFYVAATRAQEELHLFAAVKRKNDGQFAKPALGSLLYASWNAAAEHFGELAPQAPPAASDNVEESNAFEDLALAAEAETIEQQQVPSLLRRLPLTFNPAARFEAAMIQRLQYTPAAVLPRTGAFERPEGSFGVRAFGNVVHRYLQSLADLLAKEAPSSLIAGLPSWRSRLETSLRGEGLPPADAAREAPRALEALEKTMTDPIGLWLLSPHTLSASESSLTTSAPVPQGLRIDRTFRAGLAPGALADSGGETIWLIDFKTTEQGSLSDAAFEAQQRSRYSAQLESYAAIRRGMPDGTLPMRLGLYFPLLQKLIDWAPAG
jgi:ATP-dependent exoDNAse (exonuclease V) beta subunit